MNRALPGRLCPVMVNRHAELEDLRRTFDEVEAGQPQAVLVEGEAGMGKSRLCRSLVEAVGPRTAAVMMFHAAEPDMHVPFAPVIDGLRRVLRRWEADGASLADLLGPSLAALAPLAPELQCLPPAARAERDFGSGEPRPGTVELVGPKTSEEAVRQRQMFDAILSALTTVAAAGPQTSREGSDGVLLLCFEDIHWADVSTLELVRHIGHTCMRPSPDALPFPIMLVCTYRSELLERRAPLAGLVRAFTEQRLARRMVITSLSPSDHLTLLQEILGGPVDSDFAARLFAHTEGNPFVTEELLGSLSTAGLLRKDEGRWQQEHSGALHLPLTLRAAVLDRLAGLSNQTQEILRAASIIGRAFEFGLLQRITVTGEAQLLTALREAISAGLLQETAPDLSSTQRVGSWAQEEDDCFRFRHALTVDAIAADLLVRERRMLHGRIADELQRTLPARAGGSPSWDAAGLPDVPGPIAGRLAHHLAQSGQAARSRPYALAAAAWCTAIGAWSEATEYLDCAVAAMPPEDASRIEVLEQLARLWLTRQDTLRAAASLGSARDAAVSHGRLDRAAAIELDLALVQWFSHPDQVQSRLLSLHARAVERWSESRPEDLEAVRLYAGAALAGAFVSAGRCGEDALTWAERTLSISKDSGESAAESVCLALLARGVGRLLLGKSAEAIDDLEAALATARFSAGRHVAVLVGCTVTGALHDLGEDGRAIDVYRSALDEPHGFELAPVAMYALLTQGRWSEGMGAGEACAARCRERGLLAQLMLAEAACGHLLVSMGRPDQGCEKLETAWEHVQSCRDSRWIVTCLWGLGRAYHALERDDEAADAFRELYAHAAQTEDRGAATLPLLDGCTFFSHRGDRGAAVRWLTALQDIFQQTGNSVARAAVYEAVGAVALADAEPEKARPALESAVEAWQTLCRPYHVARCQVKLAEALLAAPGSRAGARSEAAALLSVAEASFAQLGASTDQRMAADLQHKSGTLSPARRRRSAPARRGTVGGLTARERDVLELLVAGQSNREIASALFIAESTAELHVSRVLGKLGCATRAQAAVHAVSQGWCPQPVPDRATA